MNPLSDDNALDTLVRSYLDRQAARVDGNAGLARVRAALAPHRTPRRVPWGSRLALAAGILVCVGLALLIGTQPATVQASSRDLVRQTRLVHQSPMERCYSVAIRRGTSRHRQLPTPCREARSGARLDVRGSLLG